ncbi:MAG: radical SAM protein [Chlorobi bacterium CHB2]|nr:radical SAM protein [Chlorobi bacterium CHB2]
MSQNGEHSTTIPMPTLAPSRKKLRVVAADFLNSLPLTVEMAEDELFNFEYVVPSEGARRMMEQEADIALLPVAAVAEIGGLEVVPGPCIGANGRVESVVIVSQVPLDSVERLFIDNASRTSVVLAKVFMDSVGKGSIPFIRMPGQEIPASVKGTDAGLLIADIAFRESKQFKYRHDLADAWKRLTGEPFVFAVWAAQPGVLTPELVERINRRFWDGIARKHQIIEEWAARHQMPKAEVADYLDERIQFNLNKSAWYGMQEFFRLASNMKLLPDARVEFATPQSPQNGINTFGKFVPEVVPYSRSYGVDRILARADSGRRISVHDAERLYLEADLTDIGEVANNIRNRMNPGGRVSYIIARNINYTNVCNVDCGFCGFYRSDDPKRKGHNEGYVLTREQLREKMNELADGDGVQALVQGGVNPNLPLEYYTNLLRWMKSEWPQIQQNSFSADEVLGLCPNKTPQEISAVLHALRDAGLDTFAGAGAEILVDRVRKRVSYKKSRSAVWLEVMRQVGIMGMKASVTMLYGMGETTRDKFAHMAKIRQLQDEVAPFMVFVTWPYQKGPDQKIKSFDQAGSTYLRIQGIARIFFDNIQHIMCSWVTQGPDIGQTALYYGADDFGSVMFEENVVSASGTTFKMDASSMEHCIGEAGFIPFRRKGDFSPWDPAEHQALKSQSIIAELTPGMI